MSNRQKCVFMAEGAGFDLPCAAGQVAALTAPRAVIHSRSRSNPLYKKLQRRLPLEFFYGGSRIRTRVRLPSNGFQDRPVMTTSVSQRMLF